MDTPDLIEHIVSLGGFTTAVTASLLNMHWRSISLPILRTTCPFIDLLVHDEVTQTMLCENLILPVHIVQTQPFRTKRRYGGGEYHLFNTHEAISYLLLETGGLVEFSKRIIARDLRKQRREERQPITYEERETKRMKQEDLEQRKRDALRNRITEFDENNQNIEWQDLRALLGCYFGYNHLFVNNCSEYFSSKLLRPHIKFDTIQQYQEIIHKLEASLDRIMSTIPEDLKPKPNYKLNLVKNTIRKQLVAYAYKEVNENCIYTFALHHLRDVKHEEDKRQKIKENEHSKNGCKKCVINSRAKSCENSMCGSCCKGCKRHKCK